MLALHVWIIHNMVGVSIHSPYNPKNILYYNTHLQAIHSSSTIFFLLYKAEKPSVRPHFWHADYSAVSAWIEAGHARNES